jgi:hypothetical protein
MTDLRCSRRAVRLIGSKANAEIAALIGRRRRN